MKITILGSGTGVPSSARAPSCCLVETGDSKIIFDSGPGAFSRLAQKGIHVSGVTHLFYTHLHPDHTLDFMAFLFASRIPGARRAKSLTVTGPQGFKEFYEKTKILYGNWMDVPFDFTLYEVLQDTLSFEDFTVESTEVLHQKYSLAYSLTDASEKKFVYSGDMDENENIRRLIKNADVFLCECSFPDALYCPGHMTPSSISRITKNAGVKKIVLTHFYPEWQTADIQKEIKSLHEQKTILAEDNMVIEI